MRVKALEANELAVAEAIQYAIQFTWGFLFARGAEVCGAFVRDSAADWKVSPDDIEPLILAKMKSKGLATHRIRIVLSFRATNSENTANWTAAFASNGTRWEEEDTVPYLLAFEEVVREIQLHYDVKWPF